MKRFGQVRWLGVIAAMIITVLAPLVCWAAAGQLDSTFGDGGVMRVIPADAPSWCGAEEALVTQPDGKFVVASDCSGYQLARYSPDGTLDASFGTGGLAYAPYRLVTAAALQPNGKLIVGGRSDWTPPSGWNQKLPSEAFVLARFNVDGSLDQTFGSAGLAVPAAATIHALALQADGKIVTVGYSNPNARTLLTLVRYNVDGSFDASFGSGGIVTTDLYNRQFIGKALVVQPDGKLVTTGDWPYDNGFSLVRYNPDGSLDLTFGMFGVATAIFPPGACGVSTRALALQADGKLVAAGDSTRCAFGLARFRSDGSIDATFGDGGMVSSALQDVSHGAYIRTVVAGPEGKLVAAGWAGTTQGGGANALVRYNEDGRLDPTFGQAGVTMPATVGNMLLPQSDSTLVTLAGRVIARYTSGVCGNGGVEPGEECDDGNQLDGDGCDSNCTYAACGNGIVDSGEECDDGNTADGDGCSAACQAQLISGGGSASTDCLSEWGVVNPNNRPLRDRFGHMSRKQVCRDNDPTCDFDGGLVGSCTFHVKRCVNVADATLPRCAPTSLAGCEVLKPSLRDAGRSFDMQSLRGRVSSLTDSTTAVAAGTCTSPVDVTVPTHGLRPGRQVIRTRTTTADHRRDIDALTFICQP